MSRDKIYYLYINTSIYSIINNISIKDNFEKDFKFHYLYIIHYIRTYPFLDRRYTTDDFIPVNMKILKKYISYDYAHIFIENLVSGEVLIKDPTYVPKLKSCGYRINPDLRLDKFRLIPVEDKKLSKKITNLLNSEKKTVIDRGDAYSYVTVCMENLILDKEKASKHSKNEFHNISIDLFSEKFSVIDKTGNRLHNNLTNVPTPLRKFLSLNGEELTQVDIKNSQPIFLYTMLRNYKIPIEELDKYKEIVCKTGFYEFFADKLNFKLTEENRQQFKRSIFGGVLFDVNRKTLSKYENVFNNEFPNIFNIIRSIKNKNHKDVSIMLQREESKFIFYCVEVLKFENKSKLPLLTIHDSIVTTTGNEQKVRTKMMELFQKLYTIEPKLKVEKFA